MPGKGSGSAINRWEEEKLEGAYDGALMRRLLRYVRPYWRLFLFIILIIVVITVADLALPYITKTVIDRFIALPHANVALPPDSDVAETIRREAPATPIDGGRFLVDVERIDSVTLARARQEGLLSADRVLLLDPPTLTPAAADVVRAHPDLFRATADGKRYIAESDLRRLSVDELTTVRADALGNIFVYAALFLAILTVTLALTFVQVFLLQYAGQKVMSDLRRDVFARMMALPVPYYDRNPVGRLVTRATNDVAAINEMVSAVLVTLFKDVFLIVGILAIMFTLNWKLTLLVLVPTPFMVWVTYEFRKRARAAYREVRRKLAKLNTYLAEAISGMRAIQLSTREESSGRAFGGINDEEFKAVMNQLVIHGLFQPAVYVTHMIALAIILWYGGIGVIDGAFTLGAIVAFTTYVGMLFHPIADLAEKYNIMQGAMAAAEKIFDLLDEPTEPQGGAPRPRIAGRIEFRNVWFSYGEPKNENDWILKDVSFTVEPGQRIAIVGPTGSGKTTMISILLRFYDIQKGTILLDGTDIREMDLVSLRSRTSVVLQDVFLFSGSIRDNISLGNRTISPERIVESARFVQADEFIRERPGGYDADVSERGSALSVGERQLLAFARAVAFDPKILILDEATANIDSRTESVIQESLRKILAGRTSIVIAHRLSTVRESDSIVVLHKGRIVEQGSHRALIANRGLYHALYTLQFAETDQKRKTS